MKKANGKPAVFFDRDGVLNVDHGYIYRCEDFEWMPGAKESIRFLNANGYFVFVITNQSGVARGYYTENDVKKLHHFMNDELAKEGAHIDAFYYCPHHPDAKIEEYRQQCRCRKPEPGMILKALDEWPVRSKGESLFLGDKLSDLQAATAAGVKGVLFSGGDVYSFLREHLKMG